MGGTQYAETRTDGAEESDAQATTVAVGSASEVDNEAESE